MSPIDNGKRRATKEKLDIACTEMDKRVQESRIRLETIGSIMKDAEEKENWNLYFGLMPFLRKAQNIERWRVLAYNRLAVAWMESW